MNSKVFIALLRGINVGGHNIIKMADLTLNFEEAGFTDVKTYIQSGNVLFKTKENNKKVIAALINKKMLQRFHYNECVVLLSKNDLEKIIKNTPSEFGKYPEKYKYDVIFLMPDITVSKFINEMKLKDGVDYVVEGKNAVYVSRLECKSAQSYLSKITSHTAYKKATIRNWNTTCKLHALSES